MITLSIPSDREQVMGIWSAVDNYTQLRIFQKLLQSAKDPKALVHEMSNFCADVHRKNLGEADSRSHPTPSQQAVGIPPQFALACKACELPQIRLPLQPRKGQVGCQSAEARKKLPDKPSLQKENATVSTCKGHAENSSSKATGSDSKEPLECIPQQSSPRNEIHPEPNETISKSLDLKTILEDRLKGVRLKRSLEKEMQARHNVKRLKPEPEPEHLAEALE
jgi:hypothetical protein